MNWEILSLVWTLLFCFCLVCVFVYVPSNKCLRCKWLSYFSFTVLPTVFHLHNSILPGALTKSHLLQFQGVGKFFLFVLAEYILSWNKCSLPPPLLLPSAKLPPISFHLDYYSSLEMVSCFLFIFSSPPLVFLSVF